VSGRAGWRCWWTTSCTSPLRACRC
jgi:hypothetical protein